MIRNCSWCGDGFDWDPSTGDGDWCSWECLDRSVEDEECRLTYWIARHG